MTGRRSPRDSQPKMELCTKAPVSSYQIRERLTRPAKHAERDAARVWPTGQYGLVYVDPPWQYEHSKTANRAIENHYPTMTLDDIKALDVQSILAPDSVVYLWATSPKLGEAFELLQAWGLTYRSSMIWVKDTIGMGYWARQRHELLLIAVNGSPHPPSPARRTRVLCASGVTSRFARGRPRRLPPQRPLTSAF